MVRTLPAIVGLITTSQGVINGLLVDVSAVRHDVTWGLIDGYAVSKNRKFLILQRCGKAAFKLRLSNALVAAAVEVEPLTLTVLGTQGADVAYIPRQDSAEVVTEANLLSKGLTGRFGW